MPLKPPPAYEKQVDHWRLSKNVLGSGTTSIVVRATHIKLPTLSAAVKVISRSGLLSKANANPAALHLADSVIHREVLLMKVAQHDRVVRLYDFLVKDDLAYIVMEHAPHKTLFDLFRASPSYLPRSLVTHIFSQLLQGLAYAHSLHIAHRDLKLENIFIFSPDIKTLLREDAPYVSLNIKIGDFGLAHVDYPDMLSTVFHGSPHYQAPEIWLRVPHHPLPTDVWSAGVVLYALLCRRLPFDLLALKNITLPLDLGLETNKVNLRRDLERDTLIQAQERYMPYDVQEVLHPAADKLLRKMFSYNPAARPTARGMLWDIFFNELPKPRDTFVYEPIAALDPRVDLYDFATLCVPPQQRIPRGSFVGSALEHAIKDMLFKQDEKTIGKQWFQRLHAYEAGKETWKASVEAQVTETRRKKNMMSLGTKNRRLEPRSATLACPVPKSTGALTLGLRFKAAAKENDTTAHFSTLVPHVRPSAFSTVSDALQDRREALLRRAYELGFGSADLRAFADEANAIVRVAREGNWRMGLQDIAREVERRRQRLGTPLQGCVGTIDGEQFRTGVGWYNACVGEYESCQQQARPSA